MASGRLVVGGDFRSFGEAAEKCLTSIMRGGELYVLQNPGLRARWCIAFVGLLVFYGGRQRPQVYAQLQDPEDLNVALRRWATDKTRDASGVARKASAPDRILQNEFSVSHADDFRVSPACGEAGYSRVPVFWPDGDGAAGGMAARAL
jgi:hypothetical protein